MEVIFNTLTNKRQAEIKSQECKNRQSTIPLREDPSEDFIELGTFIFLVDADPTASAASTMDSALPTAFSPAETADSAAASAADAALVAALRAAPKMPPPIDDKPGSVG